MKNLIKFLMVAFIAFSMTSCSKEELKSLDDGCIVGQTWKVDSAFLVNGDIIFFDTLIVIPENLTYSFYLDSIVIKENDVFMTKIMEETNGEKIAVDCINKRLFGSNEYGLGFVIEGYEFNIEDDILKFKDPYTGGYVYMSKI